MMASINDFRLLGVHVRPIRDFMMASINDRQKKNSIARALARARNGDKRGAKMLFQLVYEELFLMAKRQRQRWTHNTLDASALVHETYIKLVERSHYQWVDLQHFYAVASKAMRQLLIDSTKRDSAQKRGGGERAIEFNEQLFGEVAYIEMTFSLSRCMDRLAFTHPRWALVFGKRFFLGFTVEEVAKLLSISKATVKRDWSLATAWLRIHWQDVPDTI